MNRNAKDKVQKSCLLYLGDERLMKMKEYVQHEMCRHMTMPYWWRFTAHAGLQAGSEV